MIWTKDGWLRMPDGTNLAQEETEETSLPAWKPTCPDWAWYCPRQMPERFLKRNGESYILRGGENLSSTNEVSLLCRKLTDTSDVLFEARVDFQPEAFQQSAGIALYYDNMNWLFFRIYFSETLGGPALGILHVENGNKSEYPEYRMPASGVLFLRLRIRGNSSRFFWSEDHENWHEFGSVFPTDHFSDEYSQFGEFTGTFVGLAAVDALTRSRQAVFDCVRYEITGE